MKELSKRIDYFVGLVTLKNTLRECLFESDHSYNISVAFKDFVTQSGFQYSSVKQFRIISK